MIRRFRHRVRSMPAADRAAWAVVLVGALAAAAVVAAQDPGQGQPTPLAEPSARPAGETSTGDAGDASAEREPSPTCREVQAETGEEPVGTCRASSGAVLTIGPAGRQLVVGPLAARVRAVEFQPATTPAGRARQRARVSVRLSLLNHTERRVPVEWSLVDLTVGGLKVAPDRAAASLPGGWRTGPLGPGDRRAGELRFETAGRVTRRLRSTRRADLAIRISDRRLGVIRLRLPRA